MAPNADEEPVCAEKCRPFFFNEVIHKNPGWMTSFDPYSRRRRSRYP